MTYLETYIKQRISQNKNFMMVVAGQTGSGKSYYTLKLAQNLQPDFKEEQIVFYLKDLMKLINSNKYPPGSVFILDEFGVTHSNREWFNKANRMINFLMQTVRHRNYIFLITTPDFSFIDSATRKLIHSYAEMERIDFIQKKAFAKVFMMQLNRRSGKLYYKYLRVKDKETGVWAKLSLVSMGLATDDLIKRYEKKKRRFTDELNHKIQVELEEAEQKMEKSSKQKPLSIMQQKVYDLYQKGLDYEQIAENIGLSVSTVHKYATYARKKGYTISFDKKMTPPT